MDRVRMGRAGCDAKHDWKFLISTSAARLTHKAIVAHTLWGDVASYPWGFKPHARRGDRRRSPRGIEGDPQGELKEIPGVDRRKSLGVIERNPQGVSEDAHRKGWNEC